MRSPRRSARRCRCVAIVCRAAGDVRDDGDHRGRLLRLQHRRHARRAGLQRVHQRLRVAVLPASRAPAASRTRRNPASRQRSRALRRRWRSRRPARVPSMPRDRRAATTASNTSFHAMFSTRLGPEAERNPPALAQHAIRLAQSEQRPRHVVDAEIRHHRIECRIRVGQGFGIALVETHCRLACPADREHRRREVEPPRRRAARTCRRMPRTPARRRCRAVGAASPPAPRRAAASMNGLVAPANVVAVDAQPRAPSAHARTPEPPPDRTGRRPPTPPARPDAACRPAAPAAGRTRRADAAPRDARSPC